MDTVPRRLQTEQGEKSGKGNTSVNMIPMIESASFKFHLQRCDNEDLEAFEGPSSTAKV